MRIRIDNPNETSELLDYLRSWSDVVAEQTAADEVQASLLGSFRREAMELELELRVRAWAAAQEARGRSVEILF